MATEESQREEERAEKRGFKDALGERMKIYERETDAQLKRDLPWVVRVDGHHFSSFSRGFRKPFDARLSSAMVATSRDLLEEFGPALVYTQSDEITLVFPAPNLPADMPFAGRVSKIVSLVSSFASVRFSYHINQITFEPHETALKAKVEKCRAYFDARVFNVPTQTEAANNLLWRSHVDCRRNSILNLGCSNFSPKEMHGWSTGEVLENLRKKGVRWEDWPPAFRFGTFVKKEKFLKEAVDPKTGEKVEVVRTRVVERAIELGGFSQALFPLLFGKYWEEYDALVTKEVPE